MHNYLQIKTILQILQGILYNVQIQKRKLFPQANS